ncbi:CheR family methyltransferase, partial [Singulisphaera rosea]
AARAGSFDDRSLRLVPVAQRRSYFDPDASGQRSTIKPEIRASVTWKPHNLLLPLNEEPFDLIFIKNVLIYFDLASKQVVVKHLLDRLAMGGCLVVGPTEGIHNMLGELRRENAWAYRRGGPDVGI